MYFSNLELTLLELSLYYSKTFTVFFFTIYNMYEPGLTVASRHHNVKNVDIIIIIYYTVIKVQHRTLNFSCN